MNRSKTQSSIFGFFGFVLMLLIISPSVMAQHIRGALEGTVIDPKGAVVQGATVTLRHPGTSSESTVTTDDRGRFNFQNLEAGRYTVTIEKGGFRKYVATEVTVNVGSVTPLTANIEIGDTKEVVEVVASGEAMVDTSRPTVDGVVTPRQIENLPLNGRNFLDLAQQEPGVQVRDGGDFDPTKNQFVGVSMGGRSGRSTRIQVDGVDITDETVGTTTTNISNESIQEFQVSRSTLDASTDLTSSGAINIVTRGGSNEFHGAGFGFFRDESYAADLRLNKTLPTTQKPPFDRQTLGGRAGGFFIKNKLFWHAEFENNNQDGQQFTDTPSFAGFTEAFAVPLDERLGGARLDWKMTDKASFFYRFNHNYNFGVTGFGGRDLSAFGNLNNTNTHVAGIDYSAARWTHSGRFSYLNFNNFIVDANEAAGTPTTLDPAGNPILVRILNQLQDVGPDLLAPQSTFQDNTQGKYDASLISGNHTFRFGVSYNHIEEAVFANFFGLAPRIRAAFNSTTVAFADAQGGSSDPLNFPLNQIVVGNGLGAFSERPALGFSNGGTTNHRLGVYFTDAWKIRRNFTITLGLRYDYDSALADSDLVRTAKLAEFSPALAGFVNNDVNNFAPQAGFAWDLNGNGKTVIRGGAGIYYDGNIINNILFDRVLNLPPGLGNDTPVLSAGSPLLLDPGTGACLFNAASFRTTVGQCGPGGVNLFSQSLRNVIGPTQQMQAVLQSVTGALAANWPPPGIPPLFDQVLDAAGSIIFNEYKRPYGIMFNIGVQRELKPGLVLTVDYLRNRGVHFNQTTDLNRIGAANTLDVNIARDAIIATNDDFGCPASASAAAINCAIAAGATISDYAGFGLGAGSALDGFAFRGQNPNFRGMGLIQSLGLSTYNALTVSLRGRMIKNWGPIREMTGGVSYALSRFESSGVDQDFLSGSAFNDAPTKFFGPAGLDRAHQVTFGFLTSLPWGINVNTTTRIASPLSQSAFIDCVDCGAGEIFMSDLDGDGIIEDPLPGTNRGSFGRDVGNGADLNNLINAFNTQVTAGTLTPAGQALVTAGLFTAAQLGALGATFSGGVPVPLAPADQVGLDSFSNTDVRISKVFTIRERVKIQPMVEIFNLFNIANFDSPGGRMGSLLSGTSGTINGTTPANRTNRYGLGSGSFAPGIPRAFQFGIRVDF
ncbi:MAG: TonB-dependent receptor [Pyrinomonadaceae bacterium]|nr:TonB-dependent receptor [Pyrinomonadaceae bacterium]